MAELFGDLPPFFAYLTTLFLGLCLGSFATALAWRLPRGVSMTAKARSSCTVCGHDLSALDLVPLFSWVFLRGRCRHCRAPVSWRYPLIELATLVLCAAFHYRFGFSLETLCAFAMAPALVAMVDIDFRYKILPDVLNATVFAAGLLAIALSAVHAFDAPAHVLAMMGQATLGVIIYGGGSWALRWLFMVWKKREALGLGDVKFFAASGVWLGSSIDALAGYLLLSGVCGVLAALVWRRATGEVEFPFGPALIGAFLAVLLWRGLYFVVI